jgi:hypothetical protein
MNVLKILMNVVIQMNAIYINSQINLLNLHLKLNLILTIMDILICPRNDIDSIIFINFFNSWKSFSNILDQN